MRRILGAVAVLLASVGLVSADPPGYQQYVNPAVAAVVPVYTAVHGPQSQSSDELLAAVKELTAEVRALREELAAIRAAQTEATGPAGPKPEPLAVAKASCLKCHGPAAADDKGGGFRLFADDEGKAFAPLSPRDRQRIASRVANGTMPPPKATPPGAAEKAALVEWFTLKK